MYSMKSSLVVLLCFSVWVVPHFTSFDLSVRLWATFYWTWWGIISPVHSVKRDPFFLSTYYSLCRHIGLHHRIISTSTKENDCSLHRLHILLSRCPSGLQQKSVHVWSEMKEAMPSQSMIQFICRLSQIIEPDASVERRTWVLWELVTSYSNSKESVSS